MPRTRYSLLGSRTLLLALLLAFAAPGAAAAHLKLDASSPAAGDTVRGPLRAIRLTFSARVELRFTEVLVLTAAGDTLRGLLSFTDSTKKVVDLTLADDLGAGTHQVIWATAAADGHVVRGTIAFLVDVPRPVADPTPSDTVLARESGLVADTDRMHIPWVLTRALHFLFMLLAIGGVVFPLVLVRASRADSAAPHWAEWSAHARRLALVSAAGVLLIAMPRLLLQAADMPGDAATAYLLRDTDWGHGWLLQVITASALLLTFFAYDGSAFATALGIFGAIGLAIAAALSGHAASEPSKFIAVLNDAIHVLAAGAWLGTLAYILVAVVVPALRGDEVTQLGVARVVLAFSPLALLAGSVTVLAGLLSALSHIGPSDLISTPYGRTLLIKLGIVTLAFAMGFYNWKRVKPTLGSAVATATLRRTALLEVTLAFAVVLVTAVLVGLPTP